MQNSFKKIQLSAGFTLIELMISVAIGSFLMAGVFTVYSNGRHTQSMTEAQTQLVDDARFAMTSISYDIRHSGLWGKTNNSKLIAGAFLSNGVDPVPNPRELSTPLIVMPGDCELNWYRNLNMSFFVANDLNPYVDTCIPNGDYRPNTDVLVVKYASPTPVAEADLSDGVAYVHANFFKGELFVGKTAPQWKTGLVDQVAERFRLKTRAYFVNEFTDINGDGYPSLHRIDLSAGPSLSNTMLIPGVSDFQVQLGIDSNNNGSVNSYVNADNAAVEADMSNVKSVQFWVMLRSRTEEMLDTESQTLSIPGRPATTYSDGFRRVILSTVVKLQNTQDLNTAAGK